MNRVLRCYTPFFLYMGLLFSCPLMAKNVFPRGCENIGFNFEQSQVVLNHLGEQTLFLIQNFSDATISLNHKEKTPVFMSAGLQTTLTTNHWAALASDEQNTHFTCSNVSKRESYPVNCESVIRLCQYPRVKFAGSNMGHYWVSENASLYKTKRNAIKKGILLRW